LIRSKGVGVYFVTQNPLDIPETVLAQLGNRVQHALRAFTPKDQKAVKTAAETMRANPKFDAATAITELGVGEALVSFLDVKGRPAIVERAYVVPPVSRIGPLSASERADLVKGSSIYGHYEQVVDRESAYERLKGRAGASAEAGAAPETGGGLLDKIGGMLGGALGAGSTGKGRGRQSVIEAAAKSAARAAGSELGRQVLRGVLGSFLGGGRRR
jgi:DNA helicase HerA-like ATPase